MDHCLQFSRLISRWSRLPVISDNIVHNSFKATTFGRRWYVRRMYARWVTGDGERYLRHRSPCSFPGPKEKMRYNKTQRAHRGQIAHRRYCCRSAATGGRKYGR
jgi:hypothetical protein